MAIKLKILATSLLLSLTAFSQTATSDKQACVINLPCSTANKIATDLVRGDSAMAELKLTQELLELERAKSTQQNEIIKSYVVKDSTHKQQISLYKQVNDNYEFMIVGLERDKRKLKISKKFLGFAVGVLSVATLVEYLVIQGK